MAVFLNYLRLKNAILVKRQHELLLWNKVISANRVSYHARNVLINARNKLRHSSKKHTHLLASTVRFNLTNAKTKTLSCYEHARVNLSGEDEKNKETIVRKEDVLTIPNLLCVARIALSPVLGYLVLQHNYSFALGIFVFAGVTDLLDGMIARQFPSQRSVLGTFLDPMADKLLVSTLFLSLTVTDLIPIPLTVLIISRDVCLVTAGFYIRYLSLPSPKTLARYFDVTHATASVSPTLVSKINTSVQLSLVAFTLAASAFHWTDNPCLEPLWYITAATTIASGISYAIRKDKFKLLRPTQLNRKRLSARRLLVTRGSTTRQNMAEQNL